MKKENFTNPEVKGEKKRKEKLRQIELPEEKGEEEFKECPNCHAFNELEAKFCAECGYNFEGVKNCPKCGAKIISPNADICEVCGKWLLEGECKFCYADIEEGATYCAECGNPVAGIICPQCGRLSYFDYCKFCNIPLTGMVKKMKENFKKDPAIAELMRLLEKSTTEAFESVNSQSSTDILKMEEYMKRVAQKEKKKVFTPLFAEKHKERDC